ncbi:sirohydrochlorin chelatase [Nitrosomonas sp. Is37]|uniref:sirohydrochlorin chelatase n=1 Tax=Nitrosomonas sp. Is37 TaxID=3080535 RepID=UPI00294B85F7|nr:CbiX/SirB N-terminal domain-containing protein [Nitrosomonas sp. Is37]MDV6344209.1 cobalamin biosynthesis protein CbiX [Nitrosomonas sp. Is37]
MYIPKHLIILKCFFQARLFVLALIILSSHALAEESNRHQNQTGFLVLTADRGFVGNEEILDIFELFAEKHNAALVFVTDEHTEKYLKISLNALLDKGAERIKVIPLFISAANPRYQFACELLSHQQLTVPISYTRPYGESFFAVEDLVDKFRVIEYPANTHVLVIGYGATDPVNAQKMQKDWERIAGQAAAGFGFKSLQVVLAYDGRSEEIEQHAALLKQALINSRPAQELDDKTKTIVIPFHFGPKYDSMMSFDMGLKRLLPAGMQLLSESKSNIDSLAIWLQREANLSQPLTSEDIGVVFLAHGSTFDWNEQMREAVQPLMNRYKIEFAFSMADQFTIERAIRKLEQRSAKAAIIVRVFALEESFRHEIERMVGLDIENKVQNISEHDAHSGKEYAQHGTPENIPTRIRTRLPVRTTGGIGTSPLFAAALFDRVRALSKDPAKETIILVAHGSGNDQQNEQWLQILETLATHMRKIGGNEFRAIKVATWREDWPDKREPWIEKVRAMVNEAQKQGGRALIIPARVMGEGHEKMFLAGLEYELGLGFAPHPLFVQWVDEQIKSGMAQFRTNE